MEFAISKVSTKGQIVIPSGMRTGIKSGDEFLIVKQDGRLVLKNMKDVASELRDDLLFAERVEDAWRKYDAGKFKTKSKNDFLKELRSC